jgi:hypothetical protein
VALKETLVVKTDPRKYQKNQNLWASRRRITRHAQSATIWLVPRYVDRPCPKCKKLYSLGEMSIVLNVGAKKG